MAHLGVVPLAAKLSSATSGMVSLLVLYLLVRFLFHPRMALIATFLAAVCGWHFVFSRVGWHCISVPLWETTAMLLLLWALRSCP